jgi:hypothetical protein
MSKKKSPPVDSIPPETVFRPVEVAHLAADKAEEVAGRLTAVLVLLQHLQDPQPDVKADEDGWTLATAFDLIQSCQSDLRQAIAVQS